MAVLPALSLLQKVTHQLLTARTTSASTYARSTNTTTHAPPAEAKYSEYTERRTWPSTRASCVVSLPFSSFTSFFSVSSASGDNSTPGVSSLGVSSPPSFSFASFCAASSPANTPSFLPLTAAKSPASSTRPFSSTITRSQTGRYSSAWVTSTTHLFFSSPRTHSRKMCLPTCASTADSGSSSR